MKVNARQVHNTIGKPLYRTEVITIQQTAGDIVKALMKAVRESEPESKLIVKNYFDKSKPIYENCEKIYDFIRKNIQYIKEPANKQTAKTLKRLFDPSQTYGDCKHFATVGVSLAKAMGYNAYFRVINQSGRFNHIYCVVKTPDRVIIIDPCFPYFDMEANYISKQDIKV
jgi:hypothetical protein